MAIVFKDGWVIIMMPRAVLALRRQDVIKALKAERRGRRRAALAQRPAGTQEPREGKEGA